MKKILLVLSLALGTISAIGQKTINDPNAEIREAKNFHGISIGSAFDAYLTQSNEEAVAVSASEAKFREMIIVEVRNGILYISLKKDSWKWMKGDKRLKAYISFKNIDKMDVSGASDVYIQGTLKAAELKADVSGASDLSGKLEVGKLTIDLSGASDISVSGTATQLSIDASGASKFKAIDLVTETCDARATGASDIRITVNKELSAHATGASEVRYKGNGVIRDIKTSGAGSISKI